MKQRYELSQLLIAGLLIVSVFIQSCIHPTTAAISKEETPILEVIPQLDDQGSLKQLTANKFIAEKEHEVALAPQAEELRNANRQGEVLLASQGEEKMEKYQLRDNQQGSAKDVAEEKVESLVKLVEVDKCNEKIEARWLGDLEILPIEIVEKILTYVPCDKISKEKRGEQKVTGIFAIRQTNHLFYELTTGYSQPGLVGVEHRPNRCIHLEACMISNIISFDKLNPATIPSFIFYQFIRKVADLPKVFWPYLQGTNVHTLFVETRLLVEILEIVKNLEGTKIHTLDISRNNIGDEGIVEFAKRLQGTKVCRINLMGNKIGKVGLIEFTKNLIGTEVKELNISRNKINWNKIKSTQEILEFGQILAATKVRKIDFSLCNTLPTEQKLLAKKYPHIDWKLRAIRY